MRRLEIEAGEIKSRASRNSHGARPGPSLGLHCLHLAASATVPSFPPLQPAKRASTPWWIGFQIDDLVHRQHAKYARRGPAHARGRVAGAVAAARPRDGLALRGRARRVHALPRRAAERVRPELAGPELDLERRGRRLRRRRLRRVGGGRERALRGHHDHAGRQAHDRAERGLRRVHWLRAGRRVRAPRPRARPVRRAVRARHPAHALLHRRRAPRGRAGGHGPRLARRARGPLERAAALRPALGRGARRVLEALRRQGLGLLDRRLLHLLQLHASGPQTQPRPPARPPHFASDTPTRPAPPLDSSPPAATTSSTTTTWRSARATPPRSSP